MVTGPSFKYTNHTANAVTTQPYKRLFFRRTDRPLGVEMYWEVLIIIVNIF